MEAPRHAPPPRAGLRGRPVLAYRRPCMKRPGITTQLFLAVLATALAVAVALGVASYISFTRGFIGYLNEQAVARMDNALPRLQRAYAEHGDWSFLQHRPDVWFELIGLGPRPQPALPPPSAPPPPGAERDLIYSDLLGSGRRLTLLDAQRQHVMGFPLILAQTVQREIIVDGRTAGWLAMAPLQSVTDEASLRFVRGQVDAGLGMLLLALPAAALIAWWVARSLLAPVRRIAQATHRLAAGAHDTRVPVQGHDEVAQLAQDFNRLALALERNERMRRDYMADVSHELRTPLAVLRGELEAMEDGVHTPTPEALRLLQAEVATLTQLVDDLHELALADVGALTYRKAPLDLAALLAQEVQLAERGAVDRGLQLQAEIAPALPALLADEARLRQLLHNLIGNALRYTDRGGRVQLRLQRGGDDLLLDVMDAEPGVPDELLPRLLDRFFRVEGSRGRAGGGSGLGLAICKAIVQAHDGHIEARHSPLGGVWMQVRLPLPRTAVKAAP